MLAEKISQLQNYVARNQCDYLLVANFGHEFSDKVLYYVLLQNPEQAILLISKTGRTTLFITPFEVAQNKAKFPELEVLPLDAQLVTLIEKIIPHKSSVLVRPTVFPYVHYLELAQQYAVLPARNVDKIVAVKTNAEIGAMRAVTELTDLCFSELTQHWQTFRTEADVAKYVTRFAVEHDCEISFPTIVASGPHAAHPHHETSDEKLTRGFCVLDMGLRQNGYCSDLSRTIFIGEPTSAERALYERIQTVQARTAALVGPGVPLAEPDIFCRAELGELNEYFIHGLGHGLGTQVHEWPAVSAKNPDLMMPGMIITIEPGVYETGKYGIRIEDDVLVTPTGREVLTKRTTDLVIVPMPKAA